MLRFTVESAISGREISEKEIAQEVFPPYDPESNKVRSNAIFLREKIDKYYLDYGKDDLVRIALEPGPAYRPEFQYHTNASAVLRCARAKALMEAGNLAAVGEAWTEFWSICREHPNYALAYAGKAEAALIASLLHPVIGFGPLSEWTERAVCWARQAQKVDPHMTSAYVLEGAALLMSMRWSQAKTAFTKALEIDHEYTDRSFWYATFLLTVGDLAAVKKIILAKINISGDQWQTLAISSILCYLAREHEAAFELSQRIHRERPSDVLAGVIKLIAMQDGEYSEETMVILNDISEFSAREFKEAKGAFFLPWEYLPIKFDSSPRRLPGLIVLALVQAGNKHEADTLLLKMKSEKHSDPLQMAIAYMAVGRYGRSLAALFRTIKILHPYTAWLVRLPIFDPLLNQPRFREMVADFDDWARANPDIECDEHGEFVD